MPTIIAPPSPGSTFNYVTGMWTITTLETVWSCPEHEYGSNELYDCDDCGAPGEPECLDCLFGEYLVKFDEDGWATLIISRRRLFWNGENWIASDE